MNLRNKKVYVKDEKEENFWHKHYIWAFDFYVTKKFHYLEGNSGEHLKFILKTPESSLSSLCYVCEKELKYEIFYLTDYRKQVCIGKCCIKRYNKPYNPYSQYSQYQYKHKHVKKRFKIKEE